MKRILSMVLVLLLCLSVVNITALAERKYEAEFSILGTDVDFKNPAYVSYESIYVPLEELCGYLKLEASKNEDIYTITRGDKSAKVQLGNLVINVDGNEVQMKVSPEEYNGVIYVPGEFFEKAFGMTVATSSDNRRADINPNVYVVNIDINDAAAVNAAKPDLNTINKSTSGTDPLYKNNSFPDIERDIYYMIDLSGFAGKTIESAMLTLKAKRQEYNPTLAVLRTAPWDSTTICFNNRPQEYAEAAVTSIAKETGVLTHNFTITEMVNHAQSAGEKLSLKLEGRPHSARTTTSTVKYDVQGVNTKNAPYVTITLKENYDFPIKTVEETEEENTYDELMLLYSLGIFTEDDEFPLDLGEGVQRQEFVKYALRLRNTSANSESSTQFFADVPVDAPFYKDVMTAHSLGLVSGWEGIEFRPYDRITLGEAITILGRMLNYNIFAEQRGGFTPGYFAAARNGDLYHGAEIEKEELSFKKMLSLFEDALEAKMLNVRSYSSTGTAEYTFDESMTILSEYWNAKEIEGTVTANEYGNVIPGMSGEEGRIEIKDKKLILKYEPYNDFLGYKVRAWYNSEDELLYMGILSADITKIDIADITSKTDDENTVSFSYTKENGNYINKSFSKNSTVIFNGKSIEKKDITKDLISADGGSITLVGSDLVVIEAYTTIVVFSANSAEEEIYDLYEQYDKTLRLADADYSFVNTDGKEISLESISPKSVLSVAKSLDGKYVRGILSTDKAEGIVEMIENDNTSDMKLTVGGREYPVINLNEEWKPYTKLGTNGVFFIDAFGNIVGCDVKKTTQTFGYLLKTGKAGSAISQKLEAAIVVRGKETYDVYQFADSVKIDGVKTKGIDKIEAAFNSAEGGTFEEQGIIFETNSDGKINVVDTYYKDGQEAKEDTESTLQRRRIFTDGDLRHKTSGAIGGQYFVNTSSTLTIMKPETVEDLEDYKSKSGGFGSDNRWDFELYTIGVYNPELAIAVAEGSTSSSPGENARLMLVDRVVTAFDSDGLEVKKLYYYDGMSRKSVVTSNENASLLADIGRGDIVRFATDMNGELSAITKYFDDSENTLLSTALTNLSGFNEDNRTFGGYAERINGKYLMISSSDKAGDTSAKYTWVNSNSFKNTLYKYEANSAGVEVTPATLADIKTTTNVPFAPSGIILHDHRASIRDNVWLLEVDQPENTGIYTLTYTGEGVTEETVRCDENEEVVIEKADPTRDGHAFMYWLNEKDGKTYSNGDTVKLTENTTLTAQWVETRTYKVTLVNTEAELSKDIEFSPKKWDKEKQELVETKFVMPDAQKAAGYGFSKEGWQLIGWKDHTIGDEVSVNGDITFEAEMMPNWSGTVATEALTPVGDEYQIYTGEDLAWFAANGDKTKNVKLMKDIYLNNFVDCGDGKQINETTKNWFDTPANVTAAKVWSTKIASFSGTFNGNGKTIYGLYMQGGNGTGLFSSINGGTVQNLNIKGAYLVSTANPWKSSTSTEVHAHPVGILAANTTGAASIDGVTVYGKIVADAGKTAHCAGGIVGKAAGTTTLENCISHVVIDSRGGSTTQMTAGNVGVGGIVGIAHEGTSVTLKNCVNYGNIYAPYSRNIGGVMGWAYMKVTFDGCGNAGHIRGSEAAPTRVKEICGYASSGKGTTGQSTDSLTAKGSAAAYDAATDSELPTETP